VSTDDGHTDPRDATIATLRRDLADYLANLTATQRRCSELLEEARAARREAAERTRVIEALSRDLLLSVDEKVMQAKRAAVDAERRYARAAANFQRECAEVVRLVGVIARRQESSHEWPWFDENGAVHLETSHGRISVAFCKGDTVNVVAKLLASTLAAYRRHA
jgi:chromosome segregation ATPase